MMTDPIADMLTCIRNASSVRKVKVTVAFSNVKKRVAEILQSEGYLASVKESGEGAKKTLDIEVKFLPNGTTPVLKGIKRISKPGQRTYVGFDSIPRVRSGFGVSILSTSRGILVDRDAKKQKVGGELALNLASLYEYMVMRLLAANLNNDITLLDEVARLLGELQGAWEEIRPGAQSPKAVESVSPSRPENAEKTKVSAPQSSVGKQAALMYGRM